MKIISIKLYATLTMVLVLLSSCGRTDFCEGTKSEPKFKFKTTYSDQDVYSVSVISPQDRETHLGIIDKSAGKPSVEHGMNMNVPSMIFLIKNNANIDTLEVSYKLKGIYETLCGYQLGCEYMRIRRLSQNSMFDYTLEKNVSYLNDVSEITITRR